MSTSSQDLKRATFESISQKLRTFGKGIETSFESTDYRLTLPAGAITLVVARSGGGKTSFLLNLLLDCLRKNPDKRFYFLSYEEPSPLLAVKLLLMLSQYGGGSDDATNFAQVLELSKRLRWVGRNVPDAGVPKELAEAFRKLAEWDKKGRLYLCDPETSIDTIVGAFKRQSERERVEIGGVFVDYIQRVRVGDLMKDKDRYLQVKHISEQLRNIADTIAAPVVVGSQYNASKTGGKYGVSVLDAIRESTDVMFDASLIVHIMQPGDAPEAGVGKNATGNKLTSHGLQILKNRYGKKGQVIPLDFLGPTMTFRSAKTSTPSGGKKAHTKPVPEAGPGEAWVDFDGVPGPDFTDWTSLEDANAQS